MPTYTYGCKKCGHAFDVFHAMSASPRIQCEACGSRRTERHLGTGAGIIFKGSGFYETDYKNKKGAPAKAGGNGKDEKKADSTAKSDGPAPSGGEKKGGGDKKAASTGTV